MAASVDHYNVVIALRRAIDGQPLLEVDRVHLEAALVHHRDLDERAWEESEAILDARIARWAEEASL